MKRRVKDLAYALHCKKEVLNNIALKLDYDEESFYRAWEEPKKGEYGKQKLKDGIPQTRPINAPIKELKVLQSKILNKVLYSYELPEYFFGGIKGKDAVTNARVHQGNKYFFQTDLKDFYLSIHYSRVEKALRKIGFYPDVARVITRLCTIEGAIPQGCPTLSYLAALVVSDCANELLEKYISEQFKVTLYVDDLSISSPVDFKNRSIEILDELRKRDLKINFEKNRYYSKNPLVTGVVVKNNGISASESAYIKSKDLMLSENSRKGHLMRIDYINKIRKKKK